MAQINRMIGGVETLMLMTSAEVASISSSVVRQIAQFGGSIDNMVPAAARDTICAALAGVE
jgi:pantetheine-phosphate adenylyltransferase